MSQSKRKSFIESLVNTFVGMIVTMLFSPVIYWLCNVEISWPQMSYAMILFTVLSIARNYVIRRIFNRKDSPVVNVSELDALIHTEYLTIEEICERYPELSKEQIDHLKNITNG
jgi:hypothetical protein